MKVLAFILDNEVVEIINYDERMAAILTSNPQIVDITNHNIANGWTFDGTNFINTVNGEQVVVPSPNPVIQL